MSQIFKIRTGRDSKNVVDAKLTDDEKAMYQTIFGKKPSFMFKTDFPTYRISVPITKTVENEIDTMQELRSHMVSFLDDTIDSLPGYMVFGDKGLIWRERPNITFEGKHSTGTRKMIGICRVYGFGKPTIK